MNDAQRSCLEVEALLPLYAGADLDGAEQDSVGDHLASCSSCREALEGIQSARSAILGEQGTWNSPGPDLLPALLPSIRDEFARRLGGQREAGGHRSAVGASVASPGRRPFPLRAVFRAPLGVAAAAAVLVAVSLAPRFLGPDATRSTPGSGTESLAGSPGSSGELVEIPPVSGGAPGTFAPGSLPLDTFELGTSLVSADSTSGLRRLQPGEPTLFEGARSFDASRLRSSLANSGTQVPFDLGSPEGSMAPGHFGVFSPSFPPRQGGPVFGGSTLVGYPELLVPLLAPIECGSKPPEIFEHATRRHGLDCVPADPGTLGVDRP